MISYLKLLHSYDNASIRIYSWSIAQIRFKLCVIGRTPLGWKLRLDLISKNDITWVLVLSGARDSIHVTLVRIVAQDWGSCVSQRVNTSSIIDWRSLRIKGHIHAILSPSIHT